MAEPNEVRDTSDCSSDHEDTKSVANKQRQGGYRYRLTCSLPDESDDLFCKICRLLSRNPQLSTDCCGNTLCKSCIDNLSKTESVTSVCPTCCSSEFSVVQNKQIDRAVRSLHVYCENEKEECKWQGEIYNIDAHLNCCQYKRVECENSGCDATVQRQHLKSHVEADCPYRNVNCQYCGQREKLCFIKNEHTKECQNFPVPCPNGCVIGTVARQELNKHVRLNCSLEMIECEYYDVGCKMMIARRDIEDHCRENVEQHLCMVKCDLARTEKDLEQAQEDVAIAEKKMNKIHTDLKKLEELINDTKTQEQENIKRLEMQLYNSVCQLHKNCNPWMLKLNALAAMSTVGKQVVPVVLKITNFSKIKREKMDWDSGFFYSHNTECKMCLSVHSGVNCGTKNAYLSIQLSLMYDDPELLIKGTIKLLNQISDQEHHCIAVDCCNFTNNATVDFMVLSEWKNSCFISYNSLNAVSNTCSFVKDDCLFFEVCMTVHSANEKSQLSTSSLFSDDRKGTCANDLGNLFSSPKVS